MQIIKKYMLWILLVLTLGASFYVSQQENNAAEMDDEIVLTRAAARPINRVESFQAASQTSHTSDLLRPQLTDQPTNIFTVFVTQAELTQKNLTAPVEAPPANPFIFAGKLVDNGKVMVFLMNADKNYSVVTGDILEKVWQVRSIVPPMMTIRYLPLKIDTQLPIGALS